MVSLARELSKAANAPILRAVADGRIPVRSAAAVMDEVDRLRPLLAEGAEPAVTSGLISMAQDHGPRGVRMVRPRLLAQYGLDDVLQQEQDATAQFVALSQPRENGPGIFEYLLTLDTEGHTVLEAALGPLSAPKPTAGSPDLRNTDRRRGDALVELVRRAVGAGPSVPATAKAQLFISMDYAQLAGRLQGAPRDHSPTDSGLAAGTLVGGTVVGGTVVGGTESGRLLGPETVRRLACDATLIPLVLGTDGEILDWGRAKRLFTPAQTARLWLRDGGCTFPGCDAPAQWTDAHHLVHWADGGPTDLGNAALLCGHHHQLVHRRRLAGRPLRPSAKRPERPDPEGSVAVAPARASDLTAEESRTRGPTGTVEWDLSPGSYDRFLARQLRGEPA